MSLRKCQVAISNWVRAPEGVAKALEESGGRPTGPFDVARLQSLVRSDGKLDATSRLEIYANAYFYRILEVLAGDYEALAGLLGQSEFNDLVTSYLLVEPSRHPSLRYVGERLSKFVASHPAASGFRERSPWLADLAALEWARVSVFDAENATVLTRDSLVLLSPEKFAGLKIRTGPWIRRCETGYAVGELWEAGVQHAEVTPPLDPESVDYLVWRAGERVRHRRLEAIDSEALALAESGVCFGEVCEWAAHRFDEDSAPARAAGWLDGWLADELLVDVGI